MPTSDWHCYEPARSLGKGWFDEASEEQFLICRFYPDRVSGTVQPIQVQAYGPDREPQERKAPLRIA